MLLLAIGILALLLANVIAQTGSCSGICPEGSNLTLPDEALYSFNITCGEFDQTAKKTNNITECDRFQNLAPICGCTGYEPVCPGICSNGETISFLDKIIPAFPDDTCESFDDSIKLAYNNLTECAAIQDVLSDFCGCSANAAITQAPSRVLTPTPSIAPAAPTSIATEPTSTNSTTTQAPLATSPPVTLSPVSVSSSPASATVPTSESCSGICPQESTLTLPDEALYSFNVTCEEFDLYAKQQTNVTKCEQIQSFAPICGCTGFEPVCPGICSNGETISFPYKIIPALPDDTCETIDDKLKIGTYNQTECAAIQDVLSDICGCSASEAITQAPSRVLTPSPSSAAITPTPSGVLTLSPSVASSSPSSIPTEPSGSDVTTTQTVPLTTFQPVTLSPQSVSSSPGSVTVPTPISFKPSLGASSSVCLKPWLALYLLIASTYTYVV